MVTLSLLTSRIHRPLARFLACFCLIIAATAPSSATVPIDHAIQINVQTQKVPPTITVNWIPKVGATGYTVYRRSSSENDMYNANWVQVATPVATASGYSDTNVSVGAGYEYKIVCTTPDVTSYGYVVAGIEYPLTEDRGKLILLVDDTMATPLQFEIDRMVEDITGDGWQVIRHNISRSASTADVKSVILADYQADPSRVKSIFLFGHLPMPHSASMNPDGHESRPWPSDQYYADMDQVWQDNYYYAAPSQLELQVGRVDLWNLPAFAPLSETDLLRRYLNKDHNYRQRLFNTQQKAIIDDNFGEWYGEAFAQTGWRTFPLFVGASNVTTGDWTTPVTTPYIWAYGCGPGGYQAANGVCSTPNLVTCDPAVFTFLFGSYFGQWDVSDNFLRAELATPNYGLTCGWSGRPNWFVHHMALGETIGYATLKNMNNYNGIYSPGYTALQICLMGDPTLRTSMIVPPSSLTAAPDDLGEVTLTWSATMDTVLGYNVYRATQQGGPFTRITETPVVTTAYHDATAPTGNVYYLVRAVALQTTGAGSFYNASQGIFANCNVPFVNIPSAGRMLWLKANTGITTNGNGLVSSWADSSGNGNDLSQSVPAREPVLVANSIGVRPSVRFNGGDDVLNSSGLVVSGNNAFTTVTVAKFNSSALPQTMFWQGDGSESGGYGAYLSGTANVAFGWGGSSAEVSSAVSVPSDKWYRIVTSYDGLTHKTLVNGTLAGSATKTDSNFTTGVFSLGNYGPVPSQGFTGDIAEVFVYDRALSVSELGDVDNYLKGKYGKPLPVFSATPDVGVAPRPVLFDATASTDPDGRIVSYSWDFGDHTTGTGDTVSHTYSSAGTYPATLTVTDNDGLTSTIGKVITVYPLLTSVSASPNLASPSGMGASITFTASATGGYLPLYKFQISDGSGWQTLRDYDPVATYSWTPAMAGSYQIKVWAKSTESVATYDAETILTYVVAEISTNGLKLWLRSDAGVAHSGASVTSWADQSGAGNTVSQSYAPNMPTYVDSCLNGRSAVRFSGKNCTLQSGGSVVTGTGGFTAFTVMRFLSMPGTNYQYPWWIGTSSSTAGYGPWLSTGNALRTGWGIFSSAISYTGSTAVANWYRICSRYTAGTHEMWVNGAYIGQNGKTGSSLVAGFAVGNYASSASYQGLYGDIAEIIIYNKKLDDSERLAVEQYLAGRWTPPATVTADTLAQAKLLANGTPVVIATPKLVTAASSTFSDGSYYIEDQDRSAAIKIVGPAAALWENLTLTGVMDTDANGERIIRVQSIDTRTPGTELRAIGLANCVVTSSGHLVRVWGRVTDRMIDHFTIDDGSGIPVRVDLSGLATSFSGDVQNGYYVGATGIAGIDSGLRMVVKPRGADDVNVLGN